MVAVASSAGLGWERMMGGGAADEAGKKNYTCSSRLSITLRGGGVPLRVSNRELQYTSGSLFGDSSSVNPNHLRVLHAQPSSSGRATGVIGTARAAVGTVTKEPVTGIEFSNTVTPPGASSELSLVGAGVREKQIAFIKVKVYAVGFYINASSVVGSSSSLDAWKGKSGSELSKDGAFFSALIEAPAEKALKIVLARDIEGSQFWGALDEALTPRLKVAAAGSAGQEALASFGNVFKDRALKKGTTVFLTWSQPATLQIAISSSQGPSDSAAAAPDAAIESAALLSSLFDVYLGQDPVSPSAKAAVASGFPSLA